MTVEGAIAYAHKTKGWTGLAFEALDTLATEVRRLQALLEKLTKSPEDKHYEGWYEDGLGGPSKS
jgi:hypothetical protein